MKTRTTEGAALSIGMASFIQSFFVCVYQTSESTLIEYGKTPSVSNGNNVYLAWLEYQDPLKVRFYGFGNQPSESDFDTTVKIFHIGVTPHRLMSIECDGIKTAAKYLDMETKICTPRCHEYCEPLKGKFGFFDNGRCGRSLALFVFPTQLKHRTRLQTLKDKV